MNLDIFGTKMQSPFSGRTKSSKPAIASIDGEDDLRNESALELVQWSVCGPNTYKPVSLTFPDLTRGIYQILMTQNNGIVFQKKDVCVDDLLSFPDSLSDKILTEIIKFWNSGDKFKEHGFLHRRGFLLHGPAGSGKTCLVQQIISNIINNNGLVFQCSTHPSLFNEGLSLFRKVEPTRPIVCLFEDIDAIIDEHGEDEILTLLDGERQVNFVLNIATTNYPEKLDKRLVARPRRFDRVIEIGMPSKVVRRMYFEKKLKVASKEIDNWVNATDGFSFAACAELVISVCCFDKKFDDAINILREMMTINLSSHKYDDDLDGGDNRLGFAPVKTKTISLI